MLHVQCCNLTSKIEIPCAMLQADLHNDCRCVLHDNPAASAVAGLSSQTGASTVTSTIWQALSPGSLAWLCGSPPSTMSAVDGTKSVTLTSNLSPCAPGSAVHDQGAQQPIRFSKGLAATCTCNTSTCSAARHSMWGFGCSAHLVHTLQTFKQCPQP